MKIPSFTHTNTPSTEITTVHSFMCILPKIFYAQIEASTFSMCVFTHMSTHTHKQTVQCLLKEVLNMYIYIYGKSD